MFSQGFIRPIHHNLYVYSDLQIKCASRRITRLRKQDFNDSAAISVDTLVIENKRRSNRFDAIELSLQFMSILLNSTDSLSLYLLPTHQFVLTYFLNLMFVYQFFLIVSNFFLLFFRSL